MRTGHARRGALLVAAAACCWSSGARRPRLGWPALAFACSIAVASTCFLLALDRTSVANTLVVMSTGPYLAGLLGWLLLGERVRARSWLAMTITLAGTAVMVSGARAAGTLAGDVLALGMAAAFATGVVVVRANPRVPMAPAAALGALLASALALPFAEPLSVGARDLGLLALFGVGQFAAGFLLFTAGAPLIPAAEASLIGLLETVLGPLWVWLALGEEPGPRTLLCGAIVLGAMVIHATLDFIRPGPDARFPPSAKT